MPDAAETLISDYIREGSKAHYALLLTPARARPAAAAVLAFDAQMRELCVVSRDIAPIKLHWWHEEIERLRAGTPRHPITRTLGDSSSEMLVDRLNERLHGAVVDINSAEIDEDDLDRYLHMRSGSLFAALSAATGTTREAEDKSAGIIGAVADLLREARDPAFAAVPAARLDALAAIEDGRLSGHDKDRAVEAVLCVRREQALAALGRRSTGSLPGSILLALYKSEWPRIIAAPFGTKPALSPPWSRLWTSWVGAYRHRH